MSSLVRRRFLYACAALLCWGVLALPASFAKGSLSKVEDEFEKAIRRVTPATVVCLPWGIDPKMWAGRGSSGVIMSRKGLVLSDGDVGIYFLQKPRKGFKFDPEKHLRRSDDVEIRLPSLKGKGFQSFRAKVIKRDRELDTTLMRIEKPPSGLKYVKAGNSDTLRVGDFAFAVGNSFGMAAEAPPTLTAGVVASLVPKPTTTGGKWRYIFTSAAVNPGVNGGPLVDIRGRLVGTISSAVSLSGALRSGKKADDPELAYAYFGKVVPVERLKDHYKGVAEFDELFPEPKGSQPKASESAALATVFHHTGRRAYKAVVSLEVKRKGQLSLAVPVRGRPANIPRYQGPLSGVLVSQDGYVLTSLYNLTNVVMLVTLGWPGQRPDHVTVKAGLDGIEEITVYLPDGGTATAKVVAHHEGIGVAMLKLNLPPDEAGKRFELLPTATAEHLRPGRFVLAVGNPFGGKRLDDPLLTVGVLSKLHAADTRNPVDGSPKPWASQWQTDAGITDANCGGAAVDLHGRLLGITTQWTTNTHGRNSGIGFVVPWTQIEPILGELKRGRVFRAPFFGITWKVLGNEETTVLDQVIEGKPAHKAGLLPGDEIRKIDGDPVKTPADVRRLLKGKWSGDTLVLTIRRGGKDHEIKLTLGARE